MASPQLEDGFTRVANEILEHLAKSKLSSLKLSILLIVLRRSYGFQQKDCSLGLSYLAKATGYKKNNVKLAVDDLIRDKYVFVVQEHTDTKPRRLRFNKNYEEWVHSTLESIQYPLGGTGCTHTEVLGESPTEGTKKESNKETIKDNVYTHDQLEVLEFWNTQNIVKHSQTSELQKAIKNALKKQGKDNIFDGIKNYSTIFHDTDYFYSHIWRLDKFLKQSNGLPDFIDQGQQWINYQQRKGGAGYENIPNHAGEYGDHTQYARILDGN